MHPTTFVRSDVESHNLTFLSINNVIPGIYTTLTQYGYTPSNAYTGNGKFDLNSDTIPK